MSIKTEFSHPILAVETFPVAGPDRIHRFLRIRTSDWVNCIPITADRNVILVRQHRHGIDEVTLEIPGGAIDAGEEAATAARRELVEETGFEGGQLVDLGWVWSNPAIQNNRTHFFVVDGVKPTGTIQPDPTEDIEVVHVPLAEVPALLATGQIRHSLAVAALQRAMLRGLIPLPPA